MKYEFRGKKYEVYMFKEYVDEKKGIKFVYIDDMLMGKKLNYEVLIQRKCIQKNNGIKIY